MAAVSGLSLPGAVRWPWVLEAGCIVLVLAALVSYGANSPLAVGLCLWLAGVLCLVALLALGIPPKTRAPFSLAVGLLAALTLWITLQTLPVPARLVAPAWLELPAFGIEGAANSISLAPGETVAGWLRLTLPFMVFIAGLLIFRTDGRAQAAFSFLALAGGVLAALSLVQFVFFPETLLFGAREHRTGGLTFVFVNANTAATCLGLLMLMLFVCVRQEWLRLDRSRLLAWVMNGVPLGRSVRLWPLVLRLGLLTVVLACLALTRSRAGVGASALAATAMLVLLSWHGGGAAGAGFSRRRRSLGQKIGRASAWALGVLVAVGLIAPRAILRGEVQGLVDDRFCIMDGLTAAARDNWLTGGGFGAFTAVFAPYRDPACGMDGVWDKAHSFYLDGLIGLGLAFVVAAAVGLWALARVYRTGIRERRSQKAYAVAGLSGLVLVAVHGLVDFSLQIPGLAVFYALFAALTVTISLGRGEGGEETEAGSSARGGRVSALTVVFCGIAVLSMIVAGGSVRDAAASAGARAFARALDRDGRVDGAALGDMAASGLPANRLETCDGQVLRPALTVLLADLDRIDRDADYEAWSGRLQDAQAQVEHALSCQPADANLWLRLAMLRQAGGEVPREQAALMALSQQLGPAERRLLVGRLAHWGRLSAATLTLARDEAFTDIRNGLNYLPVSDVRAVLQAPSPAVLRAIHEALPLLSPERRKALERSGLKWSGDESWKGAKFRPTL